MNSTLTGKIHTQKVWLKCVVIKNIQGLQCQNLGLRRTSSNGSVENTHLTLDLGGRGLHTQVLG